MKHRPLRIVVVIYAPVWLASAVRAVQYIRRNHGED